MASSSADPPDVIPARARDLAEVAALTERVDRVAFMAELMAEGWLSRDDRRRCAGAWGVEENTVSRYASDALLLQKLDPERLDAKRAEYVGHLERVAEKAEDVGEFGDAVRATTAAADLAGLTQAKKVELTGKGGGPLQVQALVASPEWLAIVAALERHPAALADVLGVLERAGAALLVEAVAVEPSPAT